MTSPGIRLRSTVITIIVVIIIYIITFIISRKLL